MTPKNNPTDIQGLLDYQKRQLALTNVTESEARQRRVIANLEKWTAGLPSELKRATPNSLPKGIIDKVKATHLKPPFQKYTIISSEDLKVAKFTSYAIMYALIKSGFVTPSEIRTSDILDGYNNINGMFNSRRWKDSFFDSDAKVLVIEGSSKALSNLGSKGEDQFWREILEFTKNNDKLVIITYTTEKSEREKDVFIPLLTSDKTLNFRLIKNSLFVNINKEEEGEMLN